MKIKCSVGVIVECIIFDDGGYEFLIRQPNGQPLACVADEDDLGSYLSELRQNVIAKPTSDPQLAAGE